MIKVITVEREYGSQGAAFAHRLSDALGWKLIDSCLIDEIAQQAGVAKASVRKCDEQLDPWYYRLGKAFWHGSIDRMPAPSENGIFDSERMNQLVREYLHKAADQGHCVIVGRGAACVLTNYPGAFHMYVYASKKRKLQWFQSQFPDRMHDAEREMEETDNRRAEYVQRFYDQDWQNHRLYHLMMNSCMGFDAMLKATMEATGLAASYASEAMTAR
ncbi:Cytidylate kinase [Acidisarcina polymorpha]|uniref:Cytidylate kinase n=1 Tax=Acidisarcina polymorpha TaxID=2211140 RepID=A0A2Z5FUK5_9BACT|nr:cytidylate kinase-like family protein [Acidisarcina polymorpha]AXC10541.1 Cytidylate kinase [Acidisarcina polymorpha]